MTMVRKLPMERVHAIMDREEIDILLASYPPNVYYASEIPCNFTASNRLLYTVKRTSPVYCVIPRNEDPKLVLNNAAFELARKHTWIRDLRTYATGTYIVRPQKDAVKDSGKDASEVLMATMKEIKHKRLAIEKQWIGLPLFESMKKSLRDAVFTDADKLFAELRMLKTNEEINRFKEGTKICCRAIRSTIDSVEKGITELELVNKLKTTIMREGGDSWQQTTIAVGPQNGPDIYNQPSNKAVSDGDVIRLDVGCVYRGYTADLARTAVFGRIPKEAEKIYATIKEALESGINALAPGVKVREIHKIIRDFVRKEYDSKYTRGNVGHGVGVELYDLPEITIDSLLELQPGMTLSVEVPYHKFGLGGFNVEESVLVAQDRCQVVSDLSRELFSID